MRLLIGFAVAGALAFSGGPSQAWAQESVADAAYAAKMEAVDQLVAQGTTLFGQERYTEALEPLTRALMLSEQAFGEGPYTASVLTFLGLNYASSGRLSEAEHAYIRASAIQDALYEDDNVLRLELLINRGQLYSNTGRPAEALPFLQRANAICSRQCAPDDERVAYTRNSLAKVYRDLGRFSEADAVAAATTDPRP